jgi:hypothetical protein
MAAGWGARRTRTQRMKTLSTADDLEEICSRLANVRPEDERRWGSMSAHQMMCHLSDAFGYPLGEHAVAPVPRSAVSRALFKWVALKLPMKWPPRVTTPPEVDQCLGGTPPGDFDADRVGLLQRLDRFARGAGPWGTHPLFGPMTDEDWRRWGYLHSDHHLRQFGR